MKRPTWLEKLTVRRVSLVDNPANPHAQVLLFKGADTETTGSGFNNTTTGSGLNMTGGFVVQTDGNKPAIKAEYQCPECGKQMPSKQELDQHMAQDHPDMQKALDETKAELEAVKKELAGLKGSEVDPHVDPFKAEYETVKKDLEETRKVLGEQLEQARKELEESKAEAVKVHKQRRRERFIKRAQELSDLPGAPADDFAEMLDHIESNTTTPKEFEKLNRMLTSWNVIVKKSKIFDEIGHDGLPTFSGPEGQLKAIAMEKRAVDPKLTFEKAYDMALRENPQIYRAYLKEQEGK